MKGQEEVEEKKEKEKRGERVLAKETANEVKLNEQ